MNATVRSMRGLRLGRLRSLKSLLQKWQELNEDEQWAHAQDAPWWYTERASLSILAGAVWLKGGLAFEEYSASKVQRSGRGSRKYQGRCDLYFYLGIREFLVEAKQCWPRLTGNNSKVTQMLIAKTIDAAYADANRNLPELGDAEGLAVVFVVPQISQRKKDCIDDLIRQFVEEIKRIEDVTIAWTFPAGSRDLRPTRDDNLHKGYYYPGVALVIRRVK